jgi:hypothetical protein
MRNNIYKLVAFAIGISVMSGSIVPAFAADTTTQNTSTTTNVQAQSQANVKPVLTLEDAIAAGIANDNTILLEIKNINLQEDKLDIQDDINDSGYDYDNQELVVKQEKQKRDFMEDQVAQNITDKYNDLIAQSKSLEKIKKQIEVETKKLSDVKLQKSLGLVTSINLSQAEINIQTLKNSEVNAENKLKNSQDYFAVLTGKDLNKYVLDGNTNYEVFRIDGSVDEYLDNIIDKYLEYDKESYDLFKDHYNDDLKNTLQDTLPDKDSLNSDPTDGSVTNPQTKDQKYQKAIESYKAYLDAKFGVVGKSVTLSEKKKSYKQILNAYYTTLLSLENNINVLKANIELSNKQLSIAKLQADLGLITKTQYNSQVVASEDLDINLKGLIDSYNKIKNSIQKPWAISASSGSTAQ